MATDEENFKRGMTALEARKLDDAERFFKKVLKRLPNQFATLNLLAIVMMQRERFAEAEKYLKTALKVDSNSDAMFNNYGLVLKALKQFDESAERFSQALALNAANALTWNNRGTVFNELKRYDEAIADFDKALSLNANLPEALCNKGNSLGRLKRFENAVAVYDKALALDIGSFDALLGRGNVLRELKRHDEALAAYDKALAIKSDVAAAWVGRGNVLHDLKRLEPAAAAYDRALALDVNSADAWVGRGNVYYSSRRYDEALPAYNKAIELKPDLTPAWYDRANTFYKMQKYGDAAESFRKVLALDPDYKFAKGLLLHMNMLCCDWENFTALTESIEKDIHAGRETMEPFGYQAVAYSAGNFRRCAEIYAADIYPRAPAPLWSGERYDNPKIRIGYMSGELRNHVVSFLTAELFELHDKSRFELFAFDNSIDDGSDLRRRVLNSFDTIVDISCLDDLQAAEAVRRNQIDILVNLNGYFGDERTGVFSHRPAPVTVNYLGFSATMGADYIDYIFVDKYVLPPQSKAFYTEKAVYLPDTYQANDGKRPTAERVPTRAELGLPPMAFVFCCFNNSFKTTPQMFDIWMRLLGQVEGSVLLLNQNNETVSGNLRAEAKRRGIAPERLVFAPVLKYAEYLARYRVADLFLDTLPFNAGATASDALWAGLPLLTCSGEPYTARMAGSLLIAVGLPELITQSLEDYEALALKLARDPALLASIKAKLVANRDTCRLFDTPRFTRHVEAAYTTMWERYRRGERPESFEVKPVD